MIKHNTAVPHIWCSTHSLGNTAAETGVGQKGGVSDERTKNYKITKPNKIGETVLLFTGVLFFIKIQANKKYFVNKTAITPIMLLCYEKKKIQRPNLSECFDVIYCSWNRFMLHFKHAHPKASRTIMYISCIISSQTISPTCASPFPQKGGAPDTIMYAITPILHMSHLGPYEPCNTSATGGCQKSNKVDMDGGS